MWVGGGGVGVFSWSGLVMVLLPGLSGLTGVCEEARLPGVVAEGAGAAASMDADTATAAA